MPAFHRLTLSQCVAAALVVALAGLLVSQARADAPLKAQSGDELMQSGTEAFRRGELGAAERDWQQADAMYEAVGDTEGRLDAWLNLGAVRQQAGKFQLAILTLLDAQALAQSNGRTDKLIGINNALGVAYTFTRQPEQAERTLSEALRLAGERAGEEAGREANDGVGEEAGREANDGAGEEAGREANDGGVGESGKPAVPAGDRATLASIHNNLGNLYAAWAELLKEQGRPDTYDKAFEHYAASADLARQAGDDALAAKATTNAAMSAARGGQFEKAGNLNAQALEALAALPDSLEKANLLIAAGRADELLLASGGDGIDAGRLQRRAFDAYEQSRLISKTLDNPLTGSYAVGYQGRLYESTKRFEEALTLTRRAVLLAQQAQSPDSLYLWQWQTGRLFKALGKTEDAVAAYTSARDTLEAVRSDLALGYGNGGMKATFRADVGPLYYELADLLLTRADAAGEAAKVQEYLSDARNTVERLRVGELESYFQDPCVNQAQARQVDLTKQLDRVERGNPAVIYLIPLSDRIEILVTTRDGVKRVKSADVGSAELTAQVREFRQRLEKRTTHRYLTNAKQLYQWLIKPIEPILEAEQIDTLVFVPDGALRTVPMAALHDGKDFLIARWAVAVSPGLSLSLGESSPAQVSRGAARVLASGLSESFAGFAALPNVAQELSQIQNLYGGTKLLNDDFKVPAFARELSTPAEDGYSIVHIASHGEFAGNVNDTFVLAADGKINLGDLEALLRPYQLEGKPIDLLTLSACETSAGDDQAALERASLGLGGLAVKAGARSALASLWAAHDQATVKLITAFYTQLRDNPQAGKAKALQQAQLLLIRGDSFDHPRDWAPFLLIGDWL